MLSVCFLNPSLLNALIIDGSVFIKHKSAISTVTDSQFWKLGMKQYEQRALRNSAVVILVLTLLVSSVAAIVYAEPSTPIIIFFAPPFPPQTISQIEVYRVRVFWWNWNPSRSYDGRFLFIAKAKSFNITSNDIKLTFGGSAISPQKSGASLLYYLPKQTFVAGKTGTISVEITYNRVRTYNWQIGIVQP
jgi:hypothetical protein